MTADEFFSEIKDEEKGLTAKRHKEMLFNDVSILCNIYYMCMHLSDLTPI